MPFDGTTIKESKLTRVLRRARELITDPRNWVTGTLRARKYDLVSHREFDAYCFLGAMQAADSQLNSYGNTVYPQAIAFVGQYAVFEGIDASHRRMVDKHSDAGTRIAGLNNTLGHEVVLATLDKAIAASLANDNATAR